MKKNNLKKIIQKYSKKTIQKMKIVAFDMGVRNFAWAIVAIDTDATVVQMFDKTDLTPPSGTSVYQLLHQYLLSNEIYFQDCHTILIEQQMKTNIRALKLAQHVYAFFLLRHPEKRVQEYSSVHKTRLFGLGKTTKAARKRFTVDHVHKIFHTDPVVLDMLSMFEKQDDICDCILMCIAHASQTGGTVVSGDPWYSEHQTAPDKVASCTLVPSLTH